jgi:hypothetical protein
MAALGVAKGGAAPSLLGYELRANAQHRQRVYLSICLDPNARHSSDHRHWCFKASSRAAVQAFHRAGLAAGGGDDGAPGLGRVIILIISPLFCEIQRAIASKRSVTARMFCEPIPIATRI